MGDLFIDVEADDDWDWAIRQNGSIFSFNATFEPFKGANDSYYILSNEPGAWGPSSGIRQVHPVLYNTDAAIHTLESSSATVTGFNSNTTTDLVFSNFVDSGNPLIDLMGDDFIIAWTPFCANDVVYEKVPAPEPSTMLLTGLGLLGMGAYFRRMLKRSFTR